MHFITFFYLQLIFVIFASIHFFYHRLIHVYNIHFSLAHFALSLSFSLVPNYWVRRQHREFFRARARALTSTTRQKADQGLARGKSQKHTLTILLQIAIFHRGLLAKLIHKNRACLRAFAANPLAYFVFPLCCCRLLRNSSSI